MNFITFLRLIARNLRWLLPTAFITAAMVFHLTKDTPKQYESHTIINTGLVSGYNIESSNGGRIDYAYTNNEMENILGIARSRETKEELAARLLAQALMQRTPSVEVINEPAFSDLKKDIPENIRQQVVDYQSLENTVAQIKNWRERHDKNPIKELLESKHPLFGIEQIEALVIRREGTSDMFRLAYSTTDPSVCYNTLKILSNLMVQKYKTIKEGQSSDVLAFFEKATQESVATLNGKEDNLLGFMVQNKIINYYEQTRFIASGKESLDDLYFKEMMALAAADSARRNLEAQLNKHANLPNINQALMKQRAALSNVSAQLASIEINEITEIDEKTDNPKQSQLEGQAERIKTDLRRQAEAIFAVQRTSEGVEIKNILTQWLNQWVEVEQGLARLNVFRERKVEFDRIYSRFAPWGSRLKRLEREIEIAEKAYLENLHSYNQARLHKYNTMMTANLRIVDAPYFPDKPKPSTRLMLVMVGFMVGFILPLAVILALFLLDKSLREPERAAEMTGMEVSAAFPKLPNKWQSHPAIDYVATIRRATNQLLQSVYITLHEQGKTKTDPLSIAIVSTRGGEGKTMIAERLSGYFQRNHIHNITLFEVPALLSEDFTSEMVGNPDLVLVVCHADYTWNNADKKAIMTISKMVGRPCHLVLNNARIDYLENSLGEIPKKRSRLRRWLKQLFSMNLTKSSKRAEQSEN